MNLKGKKVRLHDMTLRDGMHPKRHLMTLEQMKTIAKGLDDAGMPLIEVTHGDGLGGSSVNYGFPAHSDEEYLSTVIPLMRRAKVSALLLPGIGTVDHLRMARDLGVHTIRVATHCTEADVSEQHITLARKLEMDTVGFLMMAHMNSPEGLARQAADAFGFSGSSGDWRSLIADPEIDVIDITAPNALHKEMALAAIAAGKHVYCEKPLAPLASDAHEMADAAGTAGVKTQVGFNYLCNPLFSLARDMIRSGELGEIRSYRGVHAEDYMADAASPFTFRHDPVGGGALADLGSHALATAEYLLGPIESVMGDCVTVIASRPDGDGGTRGVTTDDIGRAFLRFASGVSGTVEAN